MASVSRTMEEPEAPTSGPRLLVNDPSCGLTPVWVPMPVKPVLPVVEPMMLPPPSVKAASPRASGPLRLALFWAMIVFWTLKTPPPVQKMPPPKSAKLPLMVSLIRNRSPVIGASMPPPKPFWPLLGRGCRRWWCC